MPFTEAKEHAPGRLHTIFAEPYAAFDNEVPERLLHLRIAVKELLGTPMVDHRLTLRVIHGWENGGFEVADLAHSDHLIDSLEAFAEVTERYRLAFEAGAPLPRDTVSLLAHPLAQAIAAAEASGEGLDNDTRTLPSRWPAFPQGLILYTLFKVYHRLTYGEDDAYRSIRLSTSDGECEVHEFHLEEGEFAVISPPEGEQATSVLVLHESQLAPVLQLLEECPLGT
ncbi:hypothetical protein [Halomonas urumqiensis]|uniref:Uncharacterized protein n=1 Tax=Halomonas urumqiensis TaxID=1684789 RepID=A0A2N7UMI2_9GAMM|nr:hypothetical protein [Halomonas urumqiensis]PMR81636.1 hypothetical protein C1H70_04365 [Halomonas urumqiensis]PTB02273.1 hypothetical protein C6V82_11345 [Halomonas urumqiensis]GHE21741.1 hypothetical protein GCM10017767_22620 [Halomonas urumqiensis]